MHSERVTHPEHVFSNSLCKSPRPAPLLAPCLAPLLAAPASPRRSPAWRYTLTQTTNKHRLTETRNRRRTQTTGLLTVCELRGTQKAWPTEASDKERSALCPPVPLGNWSQTPKCFNRSPTQPERRTEQGRALRTAARLQENRLDLHQIKTICSQPLHR